jgi:hypothetical protein
VEALFGRGADEEREEAVGGGVVSGVPKDGWSLGEDDSALLRQLITVLRRLLPLARSNVGLIALGEALEAIEKVRGGAGIETPVALSVGVQDGTDEFNEGRFVRLRIAPDGIVLDKLSTTFTAEIGLDEVTTGYAVLEPSGGFDSAGVAAWIAEVNDLRHWDTAEIKTWS